MLHARSDYDAIQDPRNLIPDNEPVGLVRGQDISGPATLEFWADENIRNGGDNAMSNAMRLHANKMREWQKKVAAKIPDAPPNVLRS